MKSWSFVVAGCLLFPLSAAAEIVCELRVVKNTCWEDYEITVDVVEAEVDKPITQVVVPKNLQSKGEQFSCPKVDKITLHGKFDPPIWQDQKGVSYKAKQVWDVPRTFPEDTERWTITVCFPNDFIAVPIPPKIQLPCLCKYQGDNS